MLLREQQMLGRVAREFRLPEEQLRTRLVALRRDARHRQPATWAVSPAATPQQQIKLSDVPACERLLLELVLLEPGYLARIEPVIDAREIESPIARQIYGVCLQLARAGQTPDFHRLLVHFDDVQIKNLLVDLDESCAARPSAEPERTMQDLLAAFERRRREQEHRTALAEGRTDEQTALAELERLRQESRPDQLRLLEQRRK